jgi:hypothetical protein
MRPFRRSAGRRTLLLWLALALVPAGCATATSTAAWHGPSAAPGAAQHSPGTPPASGDSSSSGAAAQAAKPGPVAGKVILGAYLSVDGKTQTQSIALRDSQLGRGYQIYHTYYGWTDNLPTSATWLPSGTTLMISWDGTNYASVNNGSQDKLIAAQADRLASYDKPVYLRWAWEMNGNWYAWGGAENGNNPAGFVAAWRHIHDIFLAHHATNVAWVWGPNWNDNPIAKWNVPAAYYPGDSYVDWIGISGYSNGTNSPNYVFGPIYREFGQRKPFMIAEAGIREKGGTVKADWITELRSWVKARPAVKALVWFDTNDPSIGIDWRIDTSPGALAAFKSLANDPHFSG